MCAALRHPHIVSVLDFGIDASVGSYLVMEHLNGPSLVQQLRTNGPLPVSEVCRVASHVATALDLAHSRGIVHRDLKPANIMTHRYETGEVVYKIIDFGIGNLQAQDAPTTNLGDAARFSATLAYASPEQLNGSAVDGRADIYSLGATVYELLTGRPPFVDADLSSLITKQYLTVPPPPSSTGVEVTPAIDAAVLKALEKNPGERWATASEFSAALSELEPDTRLVPSASAWRLTERYELGDLIGRGRLGSEVYSAVHRTMGHRVAVRIVRRGQRGDWDGAKARFMREAHTTPVSHPSILQVRDYGEERDLVYVVTDLVPGQSLREVMDQEGALSWKRGAPLILDVIGASNTLHTQGVLAFGLTPSIIRVATTGPRERLVISAAGVNEIQEVLAGPDGQPAKAFALADADGLYLAPELLIGEKPDGRTDIYTIGAIGYELFTGRRLFSATTLPQLVAAAFGSEVENPRAFAPQLPAEAAECLLRCLARRPDQRFADTSELAARWQDIIGHVP